MGNANDDKVAISLHIYSPAYHDCFIFDENSGEKKKVSITTAYGTKFPFMERRIPSCPSLPPQSIESFMCKLDDVFTTSSVESSEINDVVNDLVYNEQ